MTHGTPDWWGESPTVTVHQVTDLGELAARLGSIDTFDRRGNVIWMTSFEDGLRQLTAATGGTGASVTLSAVEVKSGAYSVKLVGGSDGTKHALVVKSLAYPALSKVGFESGIIEYTTIDYVQWRIYHWDGAAGEQYTIRWYPSTNSLYYVNSVSAAVLISADVPSVVSASLWDICKLVVDLETGEYVRVLFDEQGFPLDGIAGEPYVTAGGRFIQVEVAVLSRAANNDYIWVDDLIVTQNEP